MFNSFRLNTRFAAVALGAVAIGATAFSAPRRGSAAAFSLPPTPPTKRPRRRCRRTPRMKKTTVEIPARLRRQVVNYQPRSARHRHHRYPEHLSLSSARRPGDPLRHRHRPRRLHLVRPQTITRKAEWPDWTPPPEMIARQPYLPRHMAGGPGNPLGARAMYLGSTIYRIHGTNAPETIGTRVSSGCSASPTKTSLTSIRGSTSAPR